MEPFLLIRLSIVVALSLLVIFRRPVDLFDLENNREGFSLEMNPEK